MPAFTLLALVAQTPSDDLPTSDILLGGFLLAVFLIVAYLVGSAVRARTMGRYRRLLAPHAELVGGTVRGDPECIVILGTYRGRQVTLALSPHVDDGVTTESGQGSRVFEVTLPEVEGTHDWAIEYRRTLPRLERKWTLRARNAEVERRVADSGLMESLLTLGVDSWLRYDARGRWLGIRMELRRERAPPVSLLQRQLDFLVGLAAAHPAAPPRAEPRRLG